MRGRPRTRIENRENGVLNNQGGVEAAANAVGQGEYRAVAGDMNAGGIPRAEDEVEDAENGMQRGRGVLMDEIVDEEEAVSTSFMACATISYIKAEEKETYTWVGGNTTRVDL
jgi:hypothetical protein